MTTSDAKRFASYLRFTGWNYDDGDCGNDVACANEIIPNG